MWKYVAIHIIAHFSDQQCRPRNAASIICSSAAWITVSFSGAHSMTAFDEDQYPCATTKCNKVQSQQKCGTLRANDAAVANRS